MNDSLAGVIVDQVDLVVTEFLPAPNTTDGEVVTVELSVRGECGVTVEAPLVDGIGSVCVGGGGDVEVTVPGLGRVVTASQTAEALRSLSEI